MANLNARTWFISGTVVIGLMVFPVLAWGHSNATGIVKERMDSMKDIGRATKIIAAMFRGSRSYDAAAVAAAARSVADHGGDALLSKFPKDSLQTPTEAVPEIWSDWDAFAALAKSLKEEALLVAKQAGNGPDGFGEVVPFSNDLNMPAGFAATRLVRTCKACHQKYRREN